MARSPFLSIPPIVGGCAEIVHRARAPAGGVDGPIMRRDAPASAPAGPGEGAPARGGGAARGLERVAIPFAGRPGEGSEVVVYVRKPRGVARPPVVVQWGGVDSFKEERQPIAERFLEAGFATVSIDMPGTG